MENNKKINNEHTTLQEHMQGRRYRYLWSLLFWLHLPLTIAVLFVTVALAKDSIIWLIAFVVLGIFAYSAKLYTKGEDAKAIFLTFGSVLLGFFALFAACIQDFSRVH